MKLALAIFVLTVLPVPAYKEDDRTKPFFAPELKDKTTDRFV